jgi:hypothetical protein
MKAVIDLRVIASGTEGIEDPAPTTTRTPSLMISLLAGPQVTTDKQVVRWRSRPRRTIAVPWNPGRWSGLLAPLVLRQVSGRCRASHRGGRGKDEPNVVMLN